MLMVDLAVRVSAQAFGLDRHAFILGGHGLNAEPETLWEGPEEPITEGGHLGAIVKARDGQGSGGPDVDIIAVHGQDVFKWRAGLGRMGRTKSESAFRE